MNVIIQPDGPVRLGDFLTSHLQDEKWVEFQAAVAFVKFSGVRHIARDLANFMGRGRARVAVGVDFGGSTAQGLKALIDCIGTGGQVWAYHNELNTTFHPKTYMFKAADGTVEVSIGSGNLTEGGLYTNCEAGMVLHLNPTLPGDADVLRTIGVALDSWCDASTGTAKPLTLKFLNQLMNEGYVLSESVSNRIGREVRKAAAARRTGKKTAKRLFSKVAVRRAPNAPAWAFATPLTESEEAGEIEIPEAASAIGFLMTLQQTDVGHGQVTAGKSRRSPELFIPLRARDFALAFWDYPAKFVADAARPGKMDRHGVKMWLGAQIIDVNMMTWPVKHDFRLRSEALRSAGSVDDILRMEKTDTTRGFEYAVYIVPQGTQEHRHYLSLCVNAVTNSKKLWGYY